jgi:hypothetical protein
MNKENLIFLHDSLKYLGFGESTLLNEQLEEQIGKGVREFELYTEAFFDDFTKLEAKLYFHQSDKSDRYIFSKYEALLRYSDAPEKNKVQTFFIYKGTGVTFKEAFNLLEGRAVFRTLINADEQKYKAWTQLNFSEKDLHDNYRSKQYSAHYGYDLEKVLETYPIVELQQEDTRAVLIRSLQRGNLQMITLNKPKKMEKMFVEANPMHKTINIFSVASRAPKKNGEKGSPVHGEVQGEVHSKIYVEEPIRPVHSPIEEEVTEEEPEPVEESVNGSRTIPAKANVRKAVRR